MTGPNSSIRANAVATDAGGNTVVVGSFRGTANFAATVAATTAGTQDTFVAKYGPTGGLLWARTFAGRSATTDTPPTAAVGQGSAVAIDATGGIFVAGSFQGTVNFGTTAAPNVQSSPANADTFVARLDGSGNLAWVRAMVASGGDNQANALALDGQGGVVVAGFLAGSAGMGSFALDSAAISDLYAARLDATGGVTWAVASQGSAGANAQATGVAVDASGNVALTGFYSGSVALGTGTGAATYAAAGSFDALVAKLGPSGQFFWSRAYGSTGYDTGGGVAFDPTGDVVIAGTFADSVDFGAAGEPDVLVAGPIFDAFVLKLDPDGSKVWARGLVGPGGWAKGQAVAVDPSGTIHVAGGFNGTVDFDPGPGVKNLTSVGSTDAFVAGLDAAGSSVYAVRAGQSNFTTALGLAVNAAGEVALAGTYSGSIGFGPLVVPAGGVASAFVARLQTQPVPTPSSPTLQAGSLTGTNNTTSVASPTFDVAQAGLVSVVQLLRDGTVVAQRVGPGALTDAGPVPQGVHQYAAVQLTLSGATSLASPATVVTILTSPPAAPGGLGLLAADDSGTVGDGITNVRAPRVSGQAGAGLTIQLVGATGTILATGTAGVDGSFAIALPSMADGIYTVRAVAVDAAANRSAASAAFAIRILTSTPATPSTPVILRADDSGVPGDGMTNVRIPRYSVTAPTATAVRLVDAKGAIVGTATVATAGVFTVAVAPGLADGSYTFRAVALDVAGNASAPSPATTLTVSTVLPARMAAPSLLPADDSGTKGDGLTAVRRPRITGFANPGAQVDWVTPAGTVLASTLASQSNGQYTLQAPLAFVNGAVTAAVRQVNNFGNVGPVGPATTFTVRATTGDYFGQSLTNVAIFRPANDTFYIWNAAQGTTYSKAYAVQGDIPIAGDFFGDGVGDVAFYRPSTSLFSIYNPATTAVMTQTWGAAGDVPVPADYDGDGKADIATFRPGTATFTVLRSGTGTTYTKQWGAAGDIPVPGDYFGNGHADIAVFRPSTATFFWFDTVTGAMGSQAWGVQGDIPVPGDYDGDGKTDLAVFRPAYSSFYAQLSRTNQYYVKQWGATGDIPVPGDYFGNGRSSWAVYRPSTSTFFANDPVSDAILIKSWGSPGDRPIQPPLATNYNFGGGTRSFAALVAPVGRVATAPGAGVDFAAAPIVPQVVAATPAGTVVAPGSSGTGRSRAGQIRLDLERWRPA